MMVEICFIHLSKPVEHILRVTLKVNWASDDDMSIAIDFNKSNILVMDFDIGGL
jgi:hypothetical protein